MALLKQLWRLFWKNYIIRKRSPMFLVLEVVWPILMFIILAAMRTGFTPSFINTCEYPERALPSAGMVSFLQTSICTIDNKCATRQYNEQRASMQQRFRGMVEEISPILTKNTTIDAFKSLPVINSVFTAFKNITKESTIKDIENKLVIRNMLRDDEEVVRILSTKYKLFTPAEVNGILDSSLDAVSLVTGIGTIDFKGIVCDPENLGKYVVFAADVNVSMVSKGLCGISDDLISNIANDLMKQIDIVKIVRLGQQLVSMTGAYNYAVLLNDLGNLVEMYFNSSSLLSMITNLPDLHIIPAAIKTAMKLVPLFQDMQNIDFKSLAALFRTIAPMLQTVGNDSKTITAVLELSKSASKLMDSISVDGWDVNTLMQELPAIMDQVNVLKNESVVGSTAAVLKNIPVKTVTTLISNLLNSTIEGDPLDQFMNVTNGYIEDVMRSLYGNGTVNLITAIGFHIMSLIEDTSLFYDNMTADIQNIVATNSDVAKSINGLISFGPNISKMFLSKIVTLDNFYNVKTGNATVYLLCVNAALTTFKDMHLNDVESFVNIVCTNESADAVERVLSPERMLQLYNKMRIGLSEIQMILDGTADQNQNWNIVDIYIRLFQMVFTKFATGFGTSYWTNIPASSQFTNTEEWMKIWDSLNEQYFVQARVLMPFLLAVESMEQSTLWPSISPIIKMGDSIVNTISQRLINLEVLITDQKFQALIVVFQHLPNVLESSFGSNITMLAQAASSGDISTIFRILCQDTNWTQLMNLSSNVSVYNLEMAICSLNVTKLTEDLLAIFNPMEMIADVEYAFNNNYDDGMNWTKLSSNVQHLYDTLRGNNGVLEDTWAAFVSNFPTLINNSNAAIRNTITKLTTDALIGQLEKTDNLTRTLENLDELFRIWPFWKRVKSYIVTWTLLAKSLNEFADTIKDVNYNIVEYIKELSSTLGTFVSDAISSSSALLQSLDDIVRNPEKIVERILDINFENICADNKSVGILLGMNSTSDLIGFQYSLCSLNWTLVLTEMSSHGGNWQAFASQWQIISTHTTADLPELTVNWTDAVHTTEVFIGNAESIAKTSSSLSLSDLGLNNVNISISNLSNLMQTARAFDMQQLVGTIDKLMQLFYDAPDGNDSAIAILRHEIALESYIIYHMFTFANKQLQYFNSQVTIDFQAYLHSEEADKILTLLDKSADLNEVLLNTAKDLLMPSSDFSNKIAKIVNVSIVELCNDTKLYTIIKIPPTSNMTTTEVMNVLCAANIDLKKLFDELLGGIDGLMDLVKAFENVTSGNMTDADYFIDYSRLSSMYEDFIQLVESLGNKSFTAIAPWTNPDKEIQRLLDQFGNFSKKLSMGWTTTDALGLITQLENLGLSELFSILDISPELSLVLRAQHMYMRVFTDMIYKTKGIVFNPDQVLKDYPEMLQTWVMLEMLPDLYKIYTYTAISDPGKIATFVKTLTSGFDVLCAKNPYEFMTDPMDIASQFDKIFHAVCSLNITRLEQECERFIHMDEIRSFYASSNLSSNNTSSVSDWVTDYMALVEAIQLWINNTEQAKVYRFMNASLWEQATNYIANSFVNTTTVPNLLIQSPQKILQILMSLQNIPPEVMYVLRVQQMYMLILPGVMNKTEGFLWNLQTGLKDYPEMMKIWNMTEMLPDLYQIYSYTALTNSSKVATFFESLMSGADKFCLKNPYELMTDPNGINIPFSNIFQTFCALNISALEREYERFFDALEVRDFYVNNNMTNNQTISVEDWLNAYQKLMEHVQKLTNKSVEIAIPRFLNATLWVQALKYTYGILIDTSTISQSLINLQNQVLYNVLSMKVLLPEVTYVLRVQQMYMQVMLGLMNSTEAILWNPEKGLYGYPEMRKTWHLLEMLPELYQIYSYTAFTDSSSKITTFFESLTKGLNVFCSKNPNLLMSNPPGLNVSFEEIFHSFCSLNMSALENEFQHFIDLQEIREFYAQNNMTSNQTISVTDWMNAFQQLTEHVKQLTKTTEVIAIPRFLNATIWMETSNFGSDKLMNISTIPQLLIQSQNLAIYAAVSMQVFQQDATYVFRTMQMYMEVLLGYMNRTEVVLWNPTTGLAGYPEMQKIWNLLEMLPDLYQIYSYTALTNSSKISTILKSFVLGIDALCLQKPDELMSDPPGTQLTFVAIFNTFCALNISALKQEYERFIMTEEIRNYYATTKMANNQSISIEDLTNAYQNLMTYVESLAYGTKTISVVPKFLNATVWGQAMQFVYITSLNMLSLNQSLNTTDFLLQTLWSISPEFQNRVKSVSVAYNIINKILNRLANTSENNGSIFNGIEEITDLISFLQQPGIIDAAILSVTNSQFARLLVTRNLTDLIDVICSKNMSITITLPQNPDYDALQQEFCSLIFTTSMSEFPEVFNFTDILRLLYFNTTMDWMRVVLQKNELIERTALWFTNPNRSITFDVIIAHLQRIIQNLHEEVSSNWTAVIQRIFEDDLTLEAKKTFMSVDIILEIILDRLANLSGNGSLEIVPRNSSEIIGLVEALSALKNVKNAVYGIFYKSIDQEKFLNTLLDNTSIEEMCGNKTLAAYISRTGSGTVSSEALQAVICINLDILKLMQHDLLAIKTLIEKLTTLWKDTNTQIKFNWTAITERVNKFISILSSSMGELSTVNDPILQWLNWDKISKFLSNFFMDTRLFNNMEAAIKPLIGTKFNNLTSTITDMLIPVIDKLQSMPIEKLFTDPAKWMDLLNSTSAIGDFLTALTNGFQDAKENTSNSQSNNLSEITNMFDFIAKILAQTNFTAESIMEQSVKSLLNIMKTFEGTSVLQQFKNIILVTMRIQEYANTLVQNLTANTTISVASILPRSDVIASLLKSMLGVDGADIFYAASLNPIQFLSIMLQQDWNSTLCNISVFNKTFLFPDGVDVPRLQSSFCKASSEQNDSINGLLNAFEIKTLIAEVDKILQNNTNEVDDKLVSDLIKLVKKFMTYLSTLEATKLTGSNEWFTSVNQMITVLLQDTHQYKPMCDSLLQYISNTSFYQDMWQPLLNTFQRFIQVSYSIIDIIIDINGAVCPMEGNVQNITQITSTLLASGIPARLQMLMKRNSDEGNFCSNISFYIKFIGNVTGHINTLMSDPSSYVTCLRQSFIQFGTLLQDIARMYETGNSIASILLKDKGFLELIGTFVQSNDSMTTVGNILNLFQLQDEAVKTLVNALKQNITKLESFFEKNFTTGPDALLHIISTMLQLDLANLTAHDIIENTCSNGSIPINISLATGLEELNSTLCGKDLAFATNVANSLLQYAQDVTQLRYLEKGYINIFIANVTNDLANLIGDIEGISNLLNVIGQLNKININAIADSKELLRTIQILLTDSGPDALLVSFNKLLDNFKLLDMGNITNFVLSDLKMIANGIFAFTSIRNYLAINIHLEDVVKDKVVLQNYLLRNLSLTPEVTDAIISGSLSLDMLLNTTKIDVKGWVCNSTRLAQLMKVKNASVIDAKRISQQFCSLDVDTVTALLDELVMQIDIGNLIEEFIVNGINGVLRNTNISIETTKDALEKLAVANSDLHEMLSLFDNYTASIPGTVEKLVAANSDFSGFSSLSSVICGDEIKDIGDEFHVSDTVSTSDSLTNEQKKEMDQIQGQECKNMFANIVLQQNGPIIWGYLKPILRGRILYAPNSSDIQAIIKKMNSSFELLDEVARLSKDWAKGLHSLKELTNNASGSVKELISSQLLKSMLISVSGLTIADYDSMVYTLENTRSDLLKSVSNIAEMVSNYIECLVIDRFHAYTTEHDLEAAALKLNSNNELLAGIVFDSSLTSVNRKKRQASSSLESHIHYKIRMDLDNVPLTTRIKPRMWRPQPFDNFFDEMRYFRGFIQLQDMVEDAIIGLHIGDNFKRPAVTTKQFPFPCHTMDIFVNTIAGYLFPVLLTFSWLAGISVAVYNLVYDRENGQDETLRAMGMGYGLNWLAWFFSSIIIMAFVCFIDSIILRFAGIFDRSNMGIIYLYLLDFVVSTIMMCYFVSAFFTRTSLAILASLIVYLLSYLPFVVLYTLEVQMTFWQKTLACLSSTTAISYAAQFIARYEEQEIGIQWSNIQADPLSNNGFSFSWACIMAVIDTAIYLVLGWYVRNVKPGKFGVAEPWYFIFNPMFWCGCSASRADKYVPTTPAIFAEQVSTDAPVILSARGLTKTFSDGTTAVKNLSLDIHGGCITTLLGYNGAAKTTTMNMLIGLLKPTKGSVSILNRPLKKMKGTIGICSQHNSLFHYMTVKEHMKFYSSMKNAGGDFTHDGEIKKLLNDVGLWYCRHTLVKDLSGGMQRRLCVAIAFVGGSKLVILDEPTSGVDPNGRRAIWNMILQKKAETAILLSTHHLDEADVISDQIVIMHQGTLLCQGSPMFLKKHLACGHRLTIVMESSSDIDPVPILSFLRTWFPAVKLHRITGTDMTFVLPSNTNSDFNSFFQNLETQKLPLKITSYGISDPQLEEVFLKVCTTAELGCSINPETVMGVMEENTEHNEGQDQWSQDLKYAENGIYMEEMSKKKVHGLRLSSQQFGALLVKRFHHYRRDWKTLISVVLLPLLLVLAACGLYTVRPTGTSAPNLYLSPAMYGPDTFAFVKQESHFDISNLIINTFTRNPGIGTSCMKDMNLGAPYKCVEADSQYEIPSQNLSPNGTCYCENKIYKCEGSPYGVRPKDRVTTTSEILQDLENKDVSQYLLNSFLEFRETRYGGWTFDKIEPDISSSVITKIWYNNFGWHSLPAFYNAYSNGLLRAMMNESESDRYGISVYNHPFLFSKEQLNKESILQNASDIGIALIILVAFTFVTLGVMMYSVNEHVKMEKHMQFVSGIGPFMYWMTSLIWDLIILGVAVSIAVAIIAIFRTNSFWDRQNLGAVAALVILYGWATISSSYLVVKLFRTTGTAFFTMFCTFNITGILLVLCIFTLNFFQSHGPAISEAYRVCRYVFLIFPPYCLAGGLIDMINNQLKTTIFERFNTDVYVNPFSFDLVAWNLIAMAIEGFVCFCLTIILDCRSCCVGRVQNWHSDREESVYVDSDVIAEKDRVSFGQQHEDVVVVQDLFKVYSSSRREVHAVNGLSFGVQTGQCFGLLGINGAGKTTTFNILTGVLNASKGSAFILGKQTYQGSSEVGKEMGYCPQQDALDDFLSVQDTLYFHCKLKGIPCDRWTRTVEKVIDNLKLHSFKNKLVKSCSGGMKRKVSLAIALLGDPSVVLLDEPTTGMDPKAKRLVWDCLAQAKQNGQAIILTSHSLEECDTLCDRIGIMVNGEFKCLGSSQHLKEKFSQGHTVTLYLCSLSSETTRVMELMQACFPRARVGDKHVNVIQLHIPVESIGIADLFSILEHEKQNSNISYYTVSQTTLDTIFLNFAREQSDGLALEVSSDLSPDSSYNETLPDTDSNSYNYPIKPHNDIFDTKAHTYNNPYIYTITEDKHITRL